MSESAGLSCPRCGHPVTEDEDRAEMAAFGEWICPECGFEIRTPDAAGPIF